VRGLSEEKVSSGGGVPLTVKGLTVRIMQSERKNYLLEGGNRDGSAKNGTKKNFYHRKMGNITVLAKGRLL